MLDTKKARILVRKGFVGSIAAALLLSLLAFENCSKMDAVQSDSMDLSSESMASTEPVCVLPAAVDDRIGRAQIFMGSNDPLQLIGKRDYIWGGSRASFGLPGIYASVYLPNDRDFDRTHTLSWYQANHPSWVSYQCDGTTPANEFQYSFGYYTPVDVSNLDVRNYLYDSVKASMAGVRPNGISLDNVEPLNSWKRCGVREGGAFVKKYSGSLVDWNYTNDVRNWMEWATQRAHRDGLCTSANITYRESYDTQFLTVANAVDIAIDEGGFLRNCNFVSDLASRLKVMSLIAKTKSLVVINQACQSAKELTPSIVDASLANYLLVKGNHSYFYLGSIDNAEGGAGLLDFPQLYETVGRPTEEMQIFNEVYFRHFENAIAVVNLSSTPYVIDLGNRQWQGFDGNVYSGKVTVAPNSGHVFIHGPEMAVPVPVEVELIRLFLRENSAEGVPFYTLSETMPDTAMTHQLNMYLKKPDLNQTFQFSVDVHGETRNTARIYLINTDNSSSVAMDCELKDAGQTISWKSGDGNIVTSQVQALSDGWYRCTLGGQLGSGTNLRISLQPLPDAPASNVWSGNGLESISFRQPNLSN
jgi:hypothetical protein